jgi:phosphoribosylformylglycinamidine synthase
VRPVLDTYCPSVLIYVDFSGSGFGKRPLGGSALAQCLEQLGDTCPDVADPGYFARAFAAVQQLIAREHVLAGHDVSAGGLLVCLAEMCFANVSGGVRLNEKAMKTLADGDITASLFSESPAVVLQVRPYRQMKFWKDFREQGSCVLLGEPCGERQLAINKTVRFDLDALRSFWYKPSYLMDIRQSGAEKALERYTHYDRIPLQYRFPAWFNGTMELREQALAKGPLPRAAIIREKGSQCDREMAWMLYLAGFEVRDVHTTDLISGRETLDDVRFIVFVGGFSNADTLGSAKGWAGAFLYNPKAKRL